MDVVWPWGLYKQLHLTHWATGDVFIAGAAHLPLHIQTEEEETC